MNPIKRQPKRWLCANRASALITVMIFTALSAAILGSVLAWSSNHGKIVHRHNEFIRAQYVAEAGAEKTFATMRHFMRTMGRAPNQTDLDTMATAFVPTAADNGSFADYQFIRHDGVTNRVSCTVIGAPTNQTITEGPYAGLYGLVLPYSVTSRVRTINRPVSLTAGIQRDIQYQSIPIFQFAVFYNPDLEIENGPPMVINGRVHGNSNGYFAPDTSLTFLSPVTIAKKIFNNPIPGDTHKSSWNMPDYGTASSATESATSLNMPLYPNPGGNDAHDILEMPPTSGSDPIASERFYNKAGLRIIIRDSGSIITNSAGATVTGITSAMINTTKTIYNFREGKTQRLTELNIGNLSAGGKLPSNGIVYVVDQRSTTSSQQTAVRLVNGATLPANGLTVATPNPLYIQGNYNTANRPASVLADAVNILSNNWNDANHDKSLSNRKATATTVNTAIFTGIVPTVGNSYSGGLENLPRFHEDWSGGVVFTYRGSMVVMFNSETAVGAWGNSSYRPPNRNWSFNVNFLDPTKLPPGTPSVVTLVRSNWKVVP
jgi:hypothetical protein